MACELLVFCHPTRTDVEQGTVIDIKPAGFNWGKGEHLGVCFLVVSIDKDEEEARKLYLVDAQGVVDITELDLVSIKNSNWLIPEVPLSKISTKEKPAVVHTENQLKSTPPWLRK